MHLTADQKAIGNENFRAAIGSDLLRRDFLKECIAQGLQPGVIQTGKLSLGARYFNYGRIDEPIRVGVLGTGDEGSVLIGAINPDYIQVKAIADIRPYNQFRAFHGDVYSETAYQVRPGLISKYDWKTEDEAKKHVAVFGDYRELLAEAKKLDLEAVIIALPLHLHAPASIESMQAGLHVLTEKLMGHSVANCKEMALVAAQTEKHLVTGHQRHYNILYDNTVYLLQKGLLGDIHYIRAQWHRGNLPGSDSWQQPLPDAAKKEDALAGKLAKELESWINKLRELREKHDKDPSSVPADEIAAWEARVAQKKAQISDEVLDATQYDYRDMRITDGGKVVYERPALEELIRWRLWNRTGGGLMAELGSHQLDAASIFLAAQHGGKKQHPLAVEASASRVLFPPDREVDDHVFCLYEYAAPGYDRDDPLARDKKITVQYASINGNGFGGYGETVFGTQGTLLLDREKDAMLYRTNFVNDKTKVVKNGDGVLEPVTDSAGDPLSAAIGLQATYGDISRGYTEEEEHFAYCVRNNPDAKDPECMPRCHPKVALADAVIALTTNVSMQEDRRVEFKESWFDIESPETPDGSTVDLSKYSS